MTAKSNPYHDEPDFDQNWKTVEQMQQTAEATREKMGSPAWIEASQGAEDPD